MTIANDIISCRVPDFDYYLREGESLDDIDEYGFTLLIETVITRQAKIAKLLIDRKVDINKPDVTGRTALHWAVDYADFLMVKLLLHNGANPNAYTSSGHFVAAELDKLKQKDQSLYMYLVSPHYIIIVLQFPNQHYQLPNAKRFCRLHQAYLYQLFC